MAFVLRFLVFGFLVFTTSLFANDSQAVRDQIIGVVPATSVGRSISSSDRSPRGRIHRDLYEHDVAGMVDRSDRLEIHSHGHCPSRNCEQLQDFERSARQASGTLTDLTMGRRLSAEGGDRLELTWRYQPARQGLSPQWFEVLVIGADRYQVFRVEPSAQASVALRSRGISAAGSAEGEAGQRGAAMVRRLDQAHTVVVPVHNDQRIEVMVRPVFTNDKMQTRQHTDVGGNDPVAKGSGGVQTMSVGGSKLKTIVGEIDFKDAQLESCVHAAVKGDLSTPVGKISSLNCADNQINSLAGLEQLWAIQVLDLSRNNINNINALSSTFGLFSLNLAGNDLPSIAALSNLTSLEYLHLEQNRVTDLTYLTALPALDTLIAHDNLISYIPDFSQTSLRTLDLDANPITDADGIASSLTLENVLLKNAQMGDLAPFLQNATAQDSALAMTDLRGNPSINCAQLQEFTQSMGAGGVLSTAGSCTGISIPHSVTTTANPAVLTNFQVQWQSEVPLPADAFYEIRKRRWEASTMPWVSSTTDTFLDFDKVNDLGPGVYVLDVRKCLSESDCGAWSLGIEQIVTADPAISFEAALDSLSDNELRNCIVDALKEMPSTAGGLTSLNCNDKGIVSLEGLHNFPALTQVALGRNAIQSFSELAPLPLIETLDVSDNLANSSQLQYLGQGRTGYTYLDLGGNLITDLNGLQPLNYINELRISETDVADLSPLSDVLIETLIASHTIVESIPSLTGIEKLIIHNGAVNDISGLTSVGPTLEELVLTGSLLSAPSSVLAQLGQLRQLDLSKSGLVDLSFLPGLPYLEVLRSSSNALTDISGLQSASSLRELYLNQMGLASVSFVSAMAQLAVLEAAASELTDLNALNNHPTLRRLVLGGNSLGDLGNDVLAPLASLTTLEDIVLAETNLGDLSHILTLAAHSSSTLATVDVTAEQHIPCDQLLSLHQQELLVLPLLQPSQCVASPPEMQAIALNEDLESYRVIWNQPGLPPAHVASGAYRVDFRIGTQGETNEGVLVDSTSTLFADIQLPEPSHDYYQFTVKACQSDGSCSSNSVSRQLLCPVGDN